MQQRIARLSSAEMEAISATVSSLIGDLGHDIQLGLFGSRARRDHRPDSDIDLLCLIPDGIDIDWDEVDRRATDAMASFGFDLNLQILPQSRMQDLYFDLPFLPSALKELINLIDCEGLKPMTEKCISGGAPNRTL
jgi:hypothetical protein